MDWYIVVKTINGRRYKYRQKTWREGGRVRTRSEYIGPADGPASRRTDARKPVDLTGATTLALPFPALLPKFDARIAQDAFTALTGKDCLHVPWEHHWKDEKQSENLVVFDPRAAEMVKSFNVTMTDDTTGAYFSPLDDKVNIPPQRCFLDRNGQSATSAYHIVLFHELTHWTGARGRIQRKTGTSVFDRMGYAREELVAELGAVMLMKHFGIEIGNGDRHARYFQGWLRSAGSKDVALKHAKKEAARAVKYLLEGGTILK